MKTEFDDALRGVYHEYDDGRSGVETTDYKKINPLTVLALVFAIIGCLGFFFKYLIVFPVVGVVLGIIALRKILHAPDEIGGFVLTTATIALAFLIAVSGFSTQVWMYYHKAPSGYEVVDFNAMAIDKKTGAVPENIIALNGKKVFVEGFMYPTNRQSGIEDFTMVRTLAHCKYCSPGTNPADMIAVQLEKGMAVNYRANKTVGVGGILYVEPNFKAGEIPYSIEANIFR